MPKPKLLFFAGSARRDSLNKKLAKEACQMAVDAVADATFLDLKDFSMPIYDGDLEAESGLPENARKLKKIFCEHQGIFIASPEYNSSISPLLKNSLDWISRKHEEGEESLIAFKGKIFALGAASPGGFGGLRSLVPLRMMLGNIGAFVIPNQLAMSFAEKAFDDKGKLTEAKQKDALDAVIRQLIDVTRKITS